MASTIGRPFSSSFYHGIFKINKFYFDNALFNLIFSKVDRCFLDACVMYYLLELKRRQQWMIVRSSCQRQDDVATFGSLYEYDIILTTSCELQDIDYDFIEELVNYSLSEESFDCLLQSLTSSNRDHLSIVHHTLIWHGILSNDFKLRTLGKHQCLSINAHLEDVHLETFSSGIICEWRGRSMAIPDTSGAEGEDSNESNPAME